MTQLGRESERRKEEEEEAKGIKKMVKVKEKDVMRTKRKERKG